MGKDFVPYALALKMKVLGFNEPCCGCYSDEGKSTQLRFTWSDYNTYESSRVSIPMLSQAFRWFRKEYGLDSFCRQTALDGRSYWRISKIETDDKIKGYSNFNNSYEEAELACLEKLIEIVEQIEK